MATDVDDLTSAAVEAAERLRERGYTIGLSGIVVHPDHVLFRLGLPDAQFSQVLAEVGFTAPSRLSQEPSAKDVIYPPLQ